MVSLAKLREMLSWQRGMLMAVLLAVGAVATASSDAHEASTSGRVIKPVHVEASGDKCVRDTAYMRRHHMDELKHHRKETMRKGIRTTEFSLQGCINCHADKKTNSVLGKEGFCQSCHSYAAVKLDCFECHASKPKAVAASQPAPAQPMNVSEAVSVEPVTTDGASK